MEQLVKINLFGTEKTFIADTDKFQAQRVANCLAEEIAKAENRTTGFGSNNISVLAMAALNITAKYIELKDRYDDLSKRISEKSINVIRILDNYSRIKMS